MNKIKIFCFSCKFSWGYLTDDALLAVDIKNWVPIICAGKIDPEYVVEAFIRGADGVLILGCPEGDCHYQDGNLEARKRLVLLRQALLTHGIEPERVKLVLARNPDGKDIPVYIDEMVKTIEALNQETESAEQSSVKR
jgi:F420-non-reducing hydrogenase iron-sulfur subunit